MILFIHNEYSSTKQDKFDFIYEKYYRYAYKVAFNVVHNVSEMEDIMQEVFINVWKTLDVISDDKAAKAWISTLARNTAINFLKKKISYNNKILDIEDDTMYSTTPESEHDPADLIINQDSVERIYDEMRRMNKKYADVLLLSFKFHFTPEQISEYLKRNLKTVYTQLERGKKNLKENLLSAERGKR